MTDTQVEAANIVAAWLAALSTGTDIKTVDTVVLRKRITAALDASRKDYEEVLDDHRRLVRELDVLMNDEHAAKQASLCDIVASFPQWLDARELEVWEQAAVYWDTMAGEQAAVYWDTMAGEQAAVYWDTMAEGPCKDGDDFAWATGVAAWCRRQGGV